MNIANALGEALRSLGAQNILQIGSGVTVHHLRAVKWGQKEAENWAVEFDEWLIEKMSKQELNSLFEYEGLAPHAKMAVPRAEHFVPIYSAWQRRSRSSATGRLSEL
ncbi:hypothetical protein [Paenibacillus luteus]|uniref:DODA-type extradiol aromatic ring-opening family dioxygenase n=1 Tax=Paenibacillus luteus TaxID=2545753 RepID=UPI001F501A49|nr:hypothetical protein [Paenibacillus luteus]